MHALIYAENYLRDEPLLVTVPETFEERLPAGCQVLFSPAGNKRRSVIGYVLETLADAEAAGTAEGRITDILQSGRPVLTEVTLKLALWMTDYYLSRPVEAISAMLPAPLKSTVSDIVEANDFRLLGGRNRKTVTTALRKNILHVLREEKTVTVRQLERRLGRKNLYRTLAEMERGGLLTLKKKFREAAPKTRIAYSIKQPCTDELAESLSKARAPRQADIVRKLQSQQESWFFPEQVGATPAVLRELAKKGILEKITVETESAISSRYTEPAKTIARLSDAQQQALDRLIAAYRKGNFSTFLLHGVTGSGKTIVYIEFLKEVLSSGKNAIVMVPEISLTPQTASRFRQHFGNAIRILHSAMGNREKYEAWQSLREGEARIALGPRSTVFAPLENIGAIIVDEEHDTAYKQERTPRYNGRDTAVMRAKLENAVCVLGSATPSFESFHNARTGKYSLLNLPERVDNAAMPVIRLVPMREHRKITPSLSEILYEQIKLRMEKNEQVILLQNRRGFARSLLCLDCGYTPVCTHCNIPLVYHASNRQLRCHYCGHAHAFRETCERCSSGNLLYKSGGTERIEEELHKLFPSEKILRMDVDTTSVKGAHAMILNAFHEKKSRILLGTQMVAKGLDFPDVTLVGVLMADIGLNLPDFRSGERLFGLLTQVAGRAGRSRIPGEVYLQAYDTGNEVFDHLLRGGYDQFFSLDMETRKELLYPPFAKLVAVEFSSPEESATARSADEFAEALRPHVASDACLLLGPSPACLAMIKGRFRYRLLLKLPGRKIAADALKTLQYALMKKYRASRLSIVIDVDPQSML